MNIPPDAAFVQKQTEEIEALEVTGCVTGQVVRRCAERLQLDHVTPHDLRRTCAKLCHAHGGKLEQIEFLLGPVSVLTTE